MAVYLDGWTAGKRSLDAPIIEIAGVALDGRSREIDHFETLTNPGEEALSAADPQALSLGGITREMIKNAPPPEEAARALRQFLERHWGPDIHAFDHRFFIGTPWKVDPFHWGECVAAAASGIMEKAGVLAKSGSSGYKGPALEEAARFFGVQYNDGRRALPGVRAAAGIHSEIRRRRQNAGLQSELLNFIEYGL